MLYEVITEVFKGEGELALVCEHLQTVLYRDPEAIKRQKLQAQQ